MSPLRDGLRTMPGRIVLVRHGPSAHVGDGRWIDRAGMQDFRDAQDRAAIITTSEPPPELLRMAADATHLMASDLPRAVATAERLANGRHVNLSPLLRETPLPIPSWPGRLPLAGWEALIHLRWGSRILFGTDASATEWVRAASAAAWLVDTVGDGTTALVVTHGVFRRLLAARLRHAGWTSTGRRGGYDPWSAWSLAGPPVSRNIRLLGGGCFAA